MKNQSKTLETGFSLKENLSGDLKILRLLLTEVKQRLGNK